MISTIKEILAKDISNVKNTIEEIEEKIRFLELRYKLEVGRWYVFPKYSDYPILITDIKEDGIKIKGFNSKGDWIDANIELTLYFLKEGYRKADYEEVKLSLIKEAKKRYKVGDVVKSRMTDTLIEVDEFDFCFVKENNSFYTGSPCVFKNGLWAKVSDSDAALKFKNAIEFRGSTPIEFDADAAFERIEYELNNRINLINKSVRLNELFSMLDKQDPYWRILFYNHFNDLEDGV